MPRKSIWSCMLMAGLLSFVLPVTPYAGAQAGAAGTGKIHGTVTDPSGAQVTAGTISAYAGGMTSPTQDPTYTFNLDATGVYHGDNVKAGSYSLIFRAPNTPKDKVVDQLDNVTVAAGQDVEANFDMTRQAYMDKLPPDQRKAIEEAKAKNATILKENAQIKNLNADLGKARDFDKQKDYKDAIALMQKDANIKPDAAVLWVELGLAQAGDGEATKNDQEMTDGATNLQKGITMDAAAKKPDPAMEGAANDKLGEVLATQGKIPDAVAAYDAAAKANPAQAGMYYANEAIMMDRMSNTVPAAADQIIPSTDKAIAANPNNPIPYFLKGRALVAKSTIDPKTNKMVPPDGCIDALNKYLQLAPSGPFAPDVQAMLQELGQKQQTSYKAGKH